MAEFVIRGAGAVLLRHRTNAKLTLEVIASRAGLDKGQIAKYESNKVGITDQKLAILAKALEIRPEVLAHECLMEIKPHLKSEPIGKLLGKLTATVATSAKVSATPKVRKKKIVSSQTIRTS